MAVKKEPDPRLAAAYPQTYRITENIDIAMRRNHLTNADVERYLDIKHTTWQRWKREPMGLKASALEDLSKLFGVSMSQLVGRTPELLADETVEESTPAKRRSRKGK